MTVDVDPDRAPVVELLVSPTDARAEALQAAGIPTPLISIRAMLDTGGQATLISRELAETLLLDPAGERSVLGVGSAADESGITYLVCLYFSGAPAARLAAAAPVLAVEDLTRFGVDMIAGRKVLSRCVLFYNGPYRRCTFAF